MGKAITTGNTSKIQVNRVSCGEKPDHPAKINTKNNNTNGYFSNDIMLLNLLKCECPFKLAY
jgi:hypothetical protein